VWKDWFVGKVVFCSMGAFADSLGILWKGDLVGYVVRVGYKKKTLSYDRDRSKAKKYASLAALQKDMDFLEGMVREIPNRRGMHFVRIGPSETGRKH